MRAGGRALAATLALSLGCAARTLPGDLRPGPFRFPADIFAFANETVWEYGLDPATGLRSWRRREPRPPFSLRCGTMARAARQFYAGARFDPSPSPTDASTYERLVREFADQKDAATTARARLGFARTSNAGIVTPYTELLVGEQMDGRRHLPIIDIIVGSSPMTQQTSLLTD